MDGLWPDQSPKSAINSLHQTLFFLRRDIEPWYEDGSTADYVRMEGDMVYLDSELFQVDSVAFNRQVAEIMRKGTVREQGPEMLRLYRGRFAPEFEYEEWAEDWRTQLHAAYLHLAHTTVAALVRAGLVAEAVDVLTLVTATDPHAFDLRASLISCLASLGSLDAAQAHYRTLSMLHVRDLGVPVRPFDEIVKGLPP
jgi:DNA-binding SARP family transcriptional activator